MELQGGFAQSGPAPSSSSQPMKKLSREEVQRVVETLEKMRSQGVDRKDARYATLLRILKAQSASYGHNFSSNTSPIATASPPTPIDHGSLFNAGNGVSNGSDKGAPKVAGITPYQLFQLKAQILAYKYLSRNVALPPKLLNAIRTFSMKALQQQEAQKQHTQQPVMQPQQPPAPQLVQQPPALQPSGSQEPPFNPVKVQPPPMQQFKPQVVSLPIRPPASTQQVPQTQPAPAQPIAKPASMSLAFILQERERRIKTRMTLRMEELNSLSSELTPELKRQALIEMKQLKLLEMQKKLRAQIANRMRRSAELESSADTTAYKRTRRVQREPKFTVETTIGFGRSTDSEFKKQKHAEFISAVLKHSKEFKDWHLFRLKKRKKFCKEVLNHYNNEKRRQQAEDEKQKRERLQALKEEDEDKYRMLLNEAKNERLATLLHQTDEYLEKIGYLVRSQKDRDDIVDFKAAKEKKHKKAKKKEGETEEEVEEEEDVEGKAPEGTEEGEAPSVNQKKYYTMAHAIQEEVAEQPEILIGGKLKKYQLTGLQWLVSLYNNKLNGILADEMGLGKTIQTIGLISYLMEKKNDNGPFMVVVPLSTLSNWTLEFTKWAPSISVVVYKGKPPDRKRIFKEELQGALFNVVVTSYEYVMIDKADLGKIEWDYIIIDEGHRIKNKNSKLSNTLRQYMSRHRLLLTGTPLQNDLTELWSLLNFLLPNIFNSADNFENWFNAPFSYNKGKKSENTIQPNEEETLLIINRLHKVLRPFLLRRLKQDVESELPDKVETVLKCDMSALQKKMYKNMVERGVMLQDPNAKGRTLKGFNNTLMQLQKICNHPYLFKDEYPLSEDIIRASGKFDLLDKMLPKMHATGHRLLIFNQMTQLMTIMEDYFQLRGYDYLRLDGSTKSEDRSRLVQLWNQPQSPYFLFILSTKAGGLGLNLQTADTVIIFDTDWNPQSDLQAQDRAHRIGQQKEVRILRFISHNSVEEKILEKATFKLDVDAKVIQAGMFNTHSNDKMRKAMLESLLHDESDANEVELCTSDEQINSLIARTDQEYELFQQIDAEREERQLQEAKKMGRRKALPRLMTEEELPEYLQGEYVPQEDLSLSFGRGQRVRPEVTYDDGLSELQFAKMLEKGEGYNPRRKGQGDQAEEDEDREEFQDSSRKRGRRTSEDSEDSKAKKPRLVDQCEQIWDSIVQAKNPEGRVLSDPFMRLPSRRDHPEYYKVIKRPLSLKKIQGNKYKHHQEFRSDFVTLFENAMSYNQQGSLIYEDAKTLLGIFEREYHSVFEEKEVLFSEDTSDSVKPDLLDSDPDVEVDED